MEKRDNWFVDYQSIPALQVEGKRQLTARTPYFREEDFSGKTVLDIGSNIGQMSFYAVDRGAISVLGVEYDSAAFSRAVELKALVEAYAQRIIFKLDDIDNPLFWHHIPTFDTSLYLSMIDTKELANRYGGLSKVAAKTASTMYFEGHEHQSHVRYFSDLLNYTDFCQIEYCGNVEERPFFRCCRQVLEMREAIQAIRCAAEKHQRIGIIGNQLAGKSTLMEHLGQVPGFQIFDDCDDINLLLGAERVVVSDYRATQYLDDFDAVFHLLAPPTCYEKRRACLEFTRSSMLRFTQLQSFYTVAMYRGEPTL